MVGIEVKVLSGDGWFVIYGYIVPILCVSYYKKAAGPNGWKVVINEAENISVNVNNIFFNYRFLL